MRRLFCLLVAAALPVTAAATPAPGPHPFGFEDLIRARRVGAFDVSPDGAQVAFTVTTVDTVENRKTSAVWLAPLAGGDARQITVGKKHDDDPRFSPDGRRLAFASDRDGAPQIYLLHLDGGEPRQLTRLSTGVGGILWSPDGRFLLFASEVFPDCADDACNKERAERMEKSKVSGRVIERLLFRRWDGWRDGRRSHLFRVDAATGATKDLTPGNFDAPPFSLGGPSDYDVSPDGRFVAYASNHDKVEAISTNGDLWEVPSEGGTARCLTASNKAFDGSPRYSPDGRSIAFRAQTVPGYESDRFELKIYDRDKGAARSLTAAFDGWVEDFTWSPDGARLYFTSIAKAHSPLFSVPSDGASAAKEVMGGLTAGDPRSVRDGSLVFTRVSLTRPTEIWRLPPGATSLDRAVPITHVNDALFARVTMGAVKERWYDAADGKKVQALVVHPPGFDPKRRYPALMWVHGGPQGAWEDGWSYRWNPEVLASAGYVVYLPNPRGSVGYGQDFVRGVTGDWGGKVFDDLLRGLDDLSSLPYVDKAKIGAAGASFGGFMINWFQGHTDRFRALFCHDGIADQETMYATEELWFPEFEFGGLPWESAQYRKWSPIASAAQFKTPQLTVHGEKDYRIPVEQALLMFTTLQRRGVPSKLLVFPDENHWVLKPANARLWYASMIDWFHRYLGGAPADPKALESAYSVTK
ncbi:MAG: S9 family peptidase [Myxococcales bacterium]|nr:S9 family peptidase [Myxococcales bacterium]